jgi:hypothetical protein
MDSNFWYGGTKAADFRSILGMAGVDGALRRYYLICSQLPMLARAWNVTADAMSAEIW